MTIVQKSQTGVNLSLQLRLSIDALKIKVKLILTKLIKLSHVFEFNVLLVLETS